MKTNYQGIDYGMGKVNIDNNNIRYGIIHQNEVLQAWCDESEPVYGEIECEKCENLFDLDENYFECPKCGNNDFDFIETKTFQVKNDKEHMVSDEYGDIMILKSPYFTYAQFCSPCAPGAVYLMNYLNHISDNNKGYCLGHDWFDSGKAPYPVYSVKTGKKVKP